MEVILLFATALDTKRSNDRSKLITHVAAELIDSPLFPP